MSIRPKSVKKQYVWETNSSWAKLELSGRVTGKEQEGSVCSLRSLYPIVRAVGSRGKDLDCEGDEIWILEWPI